MPLDFTAIDFETANSSNASACAVGLVRVRDGLVVDRTGWLIRPPVGHDRFTEWNVRIHGIMAVDVEHAELWREQLPRLVAFAGTDVLVAHNAGFDMSVIRAACAASYVDAPEYRYMCTLQLARSTYRLDSYRLPLAAAAAGYGVFAHHDAIADAEACAAIVTGAAEQWGAESVADLAAAAGIRVNRIAPLAEAPVPMRTEFATR